MRTTKSLWFRGTALYGLALVVSPVHAHQETIASTDADTTKIEGVAVPRRVLPYMKVTTTKATSRSSSPIGGYTRLELTFQPLEKVGNDDVDVRIYRNERRDALRRWLMGKAISRTLQIRSTLTKPNVTTTTPVISIGRESNQRVGEAWNTEFNNQRTMTPFFRIDPESAINVEADFTLTSTYDASITKAILDVIRQGAKLVAPTASLLTSENESRYKDASNFVDSSISSLLRESIVEKTANDFALKDYAGGALMTITVYAPVGNGITPGDHSRPAKQLQAIGTWTIKSVTPILSVFSDLPWVDSPAAPEAVLVRRRGRAPVPAIPDPCTNPDQQIVRACTAFRNLDPQTVLNFEVDQKKSIVQALTGEQAITTARDALIKASTDDNRNGAAQAVCALVTDKAYQLGFNRFDVAAIAWAYAGQNNLTTNAKALRDEKNCGVLKLAYAAGLPRDNFVTN